MTIRAAAGFNHGASYVQVNPRESKGSCLDFLGFLWPNWVFSTGYSESK
jgi:hypothetical protein